MEYAGMFFLLLGIGLAICRWFGDEKMSRSGNVPFFLEGYGMIMEFLNIVSIVCVFFGIYMLWLSGGV